MNKIPFDEALSHIRNVTPVYTSRTVSLQDAAGMVLAEPVYAKYNVPPAPVSAMDGFAVSAVSTLGASEDTPLKLTGFDRVNTGNVVRPQFDAVIMVEDVEFDGSDAPSEITIRSPIKAGRNVRATGEDIEEGRMILPAGARIRPFDIGALAGYGITEVPVRTVSIGIIATGSELIAPGEVPKPGQVVESNSVMTEAYLRQFGVNVIRYPPVADNRELIREAIEKALAENEIVLLSAGSSMGSKDFTASAISEIGKIVFHGVFMKPAKPTMLGVVDGKPVIGMPGFPLSAQTSQRLFVRELLELWGFRGPEHETISVVAGEAVGSDDFLDEFRFAAAAEVAGRVVALPQIRSSSMQMNGIRANCYIHIPRGTAEAKAGDCVSAVLNVPLEELSRTILLGGAYSEGSEELLVKAACAGWTVRFGDISSTNLNLLKDNACHGMCLPKGFDLSPLDGIELECFELKDDTMLVMRCDMDDVQAAELRVFAGGA